MRGRSLAWFAAITFAVVVAAFVVSWVRAPESAVPRGLLFPKLGDRVNDVAAIQIEGGGRKLSLIRRLGRWTVAQGDGYPVLMDRVKQVVVGVAEMRVAAIKTGNPGLYDRLGVEDLSARHAMSMLLTLQDETGQPLATLIVGKPRRSGAPGDRPGLYVRLPGQPQALLVDGRLDISTELTDWFDRQLFDIPASRVREVRVQHADGTTLRIVRPEPGADLAVADMPKGEDMQSNVTLSRMGTILEGFFAEGVRGAAKVQFPADATTVKVATFDGLIANISAAKIDGATFAKFAFNFDPAAASKPAAGAADAPAREDPGADKAAPPDVAGEAKRLNDVLDGWAFQVPDFKYELLDMRFEDLIRLAPKPQPLPPEAGGPGELPPDADGQPPLPE